MSATLVLPPAGPLAWLHPELALLDRALRRAAGDAAVDLDRDARSGAGLLGAHTGELAVPRGPLGASWVEWARQVRAARGGPTPQLRARGRSLEDWLARASAGGAETLHVRVSPAGALRRSPRALDEESAERRVARPDENTAWLLPLRSGPELARTLERTLDRIRRAPELFRAAELVPFFVSAEPPGAADGEHDKARVETRLALSWWGILPGDRYPEDVRALTRELVRALQPARAGTFLAWESLALAGVDLYRQVLESRFGAADAAPETSHAARALILVVCGIDGSGKSTHAAALCDFLRERGLGAEVRRIYRHGVFHDTVTDLTRLCAGAHNLHLWRIQRLVKLFDSLKVLRGGLAADIERLDALIFDRYVYTHLAEGPGRIHHDPYTRELLEAFPRPDLVWVLDASAEDALARIGTREAHTVDENPYMLERYRRGLLALAQRRGFRVLDARAPFEENQSAMRRDLEQLLARRGGAVRAR